MQLGRVCALDAVEQLAVLEDLEGGHGADAELLGDLGGVVDVDGDEVGGVTVLLGQTGGRGLACACDWGLVVAGLRVECRSDDLAGTAPVGVGVDDDDALGLGVGGGGCGLLGAGEKSVELGEPVKEKC